MNKMNQPRGGKYKWRKERERVREFVVYPSSLALIFEGLFRILSGCLNIVHRMFHMVLDPINHLTLHEDDKMRLRSHGWMGLGVIIPYPT